MNTKKIIPAIIFALMALAAAVILPLAGARAGEENSFNIALYGSKLKGTFSDELKKYGCTVTQIGPGADPDAYDGLIIEDDGEDSEALSSILEFFKGNRRPVIALGSSAEALNEVLGGDTEVFASEETDFTAVSGTVIGNAFASPGKADDDPSLPGRVIISAVFNDGSAAAIEHSRYPAIGILWDLEKTGADGKEKLLDYFVNTMVRKKGYMHWVNTAALIDWKWTATDMEGLPDYARTGFVTNESGIYYFENGEISFNLTAIIEDEIDGVWGYWGVKNSRVVTDETVMQNKLGWWYINGGRVDFSFNGLASNENGTWVIENGKVNFDFNGEYIYEGKAYNVINGKVKTEN